MTRETLTARQVFWLGVLTMFPTAALMLPGDLLRAGGRYAWWTPLVAALPALGLMWLVGTLVRRRGPLLRQPTGLLGRALAGLLWLALGAYVVLIVREFAQVAAVTFIFEDVPLPVLAAAGVIAAGLAAWAGLPVLARPAEIVVSLLLLAYVGLLVAMIPFSHFAWALPLLPRNFAFAGWQPLGRTWVWLVEPALLSLAVDEVNPDQQSRMTRSLAGAVGLVAGLLALTTWMLVADFGPARAGELVLPLYEAAREASFGLFIEHLEALFIPIVIIGGCGKLGVYYWLWARVGRRMAGGSSDLWLLIELPVGGVLAVVLFQNAVAVDAALYLVLARVALPAMLLAILGGFVATRGRSARAASP